MSLHRINQTVFLIKTSGTIFCDLWNESSGAFAQSRKTSITFVTSARLSARPQVPARFPLWTDVREVSDRWLWEKSAEKIQICLKSKKKGHLTRRPE